MKKVILTFCLIIWMGVIFSFSNSNGDDSANTSDSFINQTIINIYKIFNKDLTIEEEEEIINTFSYPIRKVAHFTEYLILGILAYFTFKEYKLNYYYLFAFLFCVFYAGSDEIHQYFINGRSCSYKDVFIDSLGSVTSISVLYKNRKK